MSSELNKSDSNPLKICKFPFYERKKQDSTIHIHNRLIVLII